MARCRARLRTHARRGATAVCGWTDDDGDGEAVTLRTLGVEEELLVVDPATGQAVPAAGSVLRRLEDTHPTDDIGPELFRHQVETRSAPSVDVAQVVEELAAARRQVQAAADAVGRAMVASGVAPMLPSPVVTDDARYRDMVDTFGEVALGAGTCAMHVHVAVDDDEEGVAVADRLRPWLSTLVAVAANSPIAEGRDTSYASWRTHLWSRWPTAGPGERFGSVEEYRRLSRVLVETGAARDPGMLYFDARLAVEHPTLEVRVCDVATDVEVAGALAAWIRALVETTAREHAEGAPMPDLRVEEVRAARWRATRFGLDDRLVEPRTGSLAPAAEVVRHAVDHARAALEEAGDHERVAACVDDLLTHGTGAARQRAILRRSGTVAAVVEDLIERSVQGA